MPIPRQWLTGAVAANLVATLLVATPAKAAPEPGQDRPALVADRAPVAGRPVKVRPRTPDPARDDTVRVPRWPTSDAGVTASGGARVRVSDRAVAQRAGVSGVVFTVDGAAATRVRVDYARFAAAYGGSYGSRLRLVRLPACALSTPERADCRTVSPVPAVNDAADTALVADVRAGTTAVLAAVAGAAGDKGDFRATPLAPSATWSAGRGSGDFTWSYPFRVPPVPGGLDPDLAISYSSASLDGRTSNTNNQPSWVGEGFDLSVGYIERRYKGCADDGAPPSNGVKPGDLCWAYDNATVAWGGKGGELIRAADGTWRLRQDDGTRFEHLTDAGIGNGDNDGEYWKATAVDGTQYFFGRHRLPGWSTGKGTTNSAWTVPVFGNNSGEPCYDAAGFAGSSCAQAWRWNLDYVVDPHGNAMTYYYSTQNNAYGRNVSLSADAEYVRDGQLLRIEYGLRAANLFTAPPAKVLFGTAERCLRDSGFDCAPSRIATNPERWPDVPWDQNCVSGCTRAGNIAPTFWSRLRLTSVTTQILRADGVYRDVDAWALDHNWGDADVDRALLLASIQQTGKAASPSVPLPKVTFNHVQLMNRVDQVGDDIPPFVKYRLGAIYDEAGGQIDVSYSARDCTLASLPVPESNDRRCFPTYWQPAGADRPVRDWFHKYVVTQVIVSDRTARSPEMVTSYTYPEGAAWHYDDDDGLSRAGVKTWSQWRGYDLVRVMTGGIGSPGSRSEYRYLRGMHGDRLNPGGGTTTVTVTDGEGGAHVDHEAFAGFLLKHTVYTGPNGTVHEKTVNTPWRQQTAIRTRSWGTTTANLIGAASVRTWSAMDGGAWRQTRTDTARDSRTGLPTQVDDLGDVATSTDDRCIRTAYAANVSAWLLSLPTREETVAVRCAVAPDRARHLVSDTRRHYDNGGFGAVPVRGDVTRLEEVSAHDGTTATYVPTARTMFDGYGRATAVTDAAGNTDRTTYIETAGLTTGIVTEGPAVAAGPHKAARTIDPAWGQPTSSTDAGNATTTATRDALGRIAKLWAPGRAGAAVPDAGYSYRFADGQIVAVTTTTLGPNGGTRVGVELYDGLLRPRQTQISGPGGGRLLTDTFHDSRGNVARAFETYYAPGIPSTTLFGVDSPGAVESQRTYAYDGLGRVTVERLLAGNNDSQEKWRTVTSYGGGWTAVDPPDGAPATMTLTDARGRRTEVRHFRGSTPTGGYDSTRYTYQPDGNVHTMTGVDGATWTYDNDLRGRRISVSDPDRGTNTYTYDDLDQPVTSTDGRGRMLFYRHDAMGRPTEIRESTSGGPLRTSFVWDTARVGQLTEATRWVGGQPYTTRVDVFDNANRPLKTTIDIPSALGALAGRYTFTTAYNPDGSVRSTGQPEAGGLSAENIVASYDDLGRPTRLTSNLATYVNATSYSDTGQLRQYEFLTGARKAWQTLTWEYATGRLATSRTDREGVPGVDHGATYAYDPSGNITSIVDVSRSGTDNQCFGYDHAQRLTEAWTQGTTACAPSPSPAAVGGPAPYWHSYTYDTGGSRTGEILHGVGGQADTVRSYTNRGHRVERVAQSGRTDSFAYDAAGNMTNRTVGGAPQILDWDAGGDLTTVTEGGRTTTYVYGPGGQRLVRRDPSGTTLYLTGMELHLPTGASVANGTRYYTHGGATVAVRGIRGVQVLTADHQDTAQIAIDTSSQTLSKRRFTPFGTARGTTTGTWPDDKTFVGGTKDASTGLTHLGAREYDPALGRFVSADPMVLDDPQQRHGYSYANNSPVMLSDPSGLAPCGGGGGSWQLASYGGGCDSDSDGAPAEQGSGHGSAPGRGGGGGGGGGYVPGRGGAGAGPGTGPGKGGPPAIGPIRICDGWCQIRETIGDQGGERAGTQPDVQPVDVCLPMTPFRCVKPSMPTLPKPDLPDLGFPDLGDVFEGIKKDCQTLQLFFCSWFAIEKIAALFVIAGWVMMIGYGFSMFFGAACAAACHVLAAIGLVIGIVLALMMLRAMLRFYAEKGTKPHPPDA
ncbi:RHS repeat-associated core domain-containing protein [Asanoa sp. WMMD1127]|uniref:RHS repeat-associated core domain-containing protein n=1 Tax=Asanoa sp. WMMD1127 TaxID=3016107 RepID=UPI002416FD96|nr:RHS repeat-associated core domain-containing protein [Asanoa sp. WMMD1127]MDG4820801.1 RHS repeat-associated core domain-containing protein [Asanoa sp. WMMD1127]